MTIHQVRHLAANIVLDAHPEAYPLVQQLLGHKNLGTTVKTYAGVNSRRASRSYASLLETMKSTPIDLTAGRRHGGPKLPRQKSSTTETGPKPQDKDPEEKGSIEQPGRTPVTTENT